MNAKKSGPPIWETAIIALSFVGLCAWYFARQSAYKAGFEPSNAWHLIPLALFVLLVWVLIRRAKRATAAMRDLKGGR